METLVFIVLYQSAILIYTRRDSIYSYMYLRSVFESVHSVQAPAEVLDRYTKNSQNLAT